MVISLQPCQNRIKQSILFIFILSFKCIFQIFFYSEAQTINMYNEQNKPHFSDFMNLKLTKYIYRQNIISYYNTLNIDIKTVYQCVYLNGQVTVNCVFFSLCYFILLHWDIFFFFFISCCRCIFMAVIVDWVKYNTFCSWVCHVWFWFWFVGIFDFFSFAVFVLFSFLASWQALHGVFNNNECL